MSQPSNNPLVQQMQLLLTGYGYNFYNQKNQARADDLLIRQKAAGSLDEAAHSLSNLESEYQCRYIPAATRENPYPPAEAMAKQREITHLREQVASLATRIRGMSVPTQDRIWWRFRDEQTLLNQLIQFDYQLISRTEYLYQQLHNLTAAAWHQNDPATQFEEPLHTLDQIVRDRQRFLQIPG